MDERELMIGRLRTRGALRSDRIAEALRLVPREEFVPADRAIDAYVDRAVPIKWDEGGRPISSVSQPTMVALMLEALDLRGGQRVLEVGTGSGYNAALLAVLVGRAGEVVSVELEPDLAAHARDVLASTVGPGRVDVVVGDGYLGAPAGAPYDRIVVTTGAPDVAPAWVEQLVADGRLVVPVVDPRSGAGVVRVSVRTPVGLDAIADLPCGFLPLRRPAG